MLKQERVAYILQRLQELYPETPVPLDHFDPFSLLVAVLAYLVLMSFLNDVVVGAMLAAVGGIMVFISLDELLPSAQKYGEHHLSIYGLIAGMIVMALSLLLFM